MHLYHILLMIYNDSQADVDAFVIGEDPTIPQTPRPRKCPRKRPDVMETDYTRLRNELAHKRHSEPRQDEGRHGQPLGGLVALTKRAIDYIRSIESCLTKACRQQLQH